MQKTTRKNKVYSPDLIINIVLDMITNHLSYKETIRKYWDNSKGKENNHKNQLKLWERIYLVEGADGLMKEQRGKTTKSDNPKKGRPPKLDKNVEKDLIAENQRLRMENEYLKKLSALVLAEEQKNGKKH
ncbi:MAG: hypothetical protein RR348_02285 [Clostridia bacterium]